MSRQLRRPREVRGPGQLAHPTQHGDPRRKPLRRHALHLLQPDLRVAERDRLLHEEGRRDLLGGALEPALLGDAPPPTPRRSSSLSMPPARSWDLRVSDGFRFEGPLPARRDRLRDQDARGDPDRRSTCRRETVCARPTSSSAAATASISPSSGSRRPPDGRRRNDRDREDRADRGRIRPGRSRQSGSASRGKKLTDDLIEEAASAAYRPAKPLDNTDLTNAYRKKMAKLYVARALRELKSAGES